MRKPQYEVEVELTIPKAISEAVMVIGGHELRVYQLEDGTRIINADDVHKFFGTVEKCTEAMRTDLLTNHDGQKQ